MDQALADTLETPENLARPRTLARGTTLNFGCAPDGSALLRRARAALNEARRAPALVGAGQDACTTNLKSAVDLWIRALD